MLASKVSKNAVTYQTSGCLTPKFCDFAAKQALKYVDRTVNIDRNKSHFNHSKIGDGP